MASSDKISSLRVKRLLRCFCILVAHVCFDTASKIKQVLLPSQSVIRTDVRTSSEYLGNFHCSRSLILSVCVLFLTSTSLNSREEGVNSMLPFPSLILTTPAPSSTDRRVSRSVLIVVVVVVAPHNKSGKTRCEFASPPRFLNPLLFQPLRLFFLPLHRTSIHLRRALPLSNSSLPPSAPSSTTHTTHLSSCLNGTLLFVSNHFARAHCSAPSPNPHS
jgi:hypothetical protein